LSIQAIHFLETGSHDLTRLVTERHRSILSRMATRLRLPSRLTVYEAGSPARWLFVVGEGSVKSYRQLEDGTRRVSGFLFAKDLFGLAEQGRYVNTVQTMSPATLYRIPFDELKSELRHDGELAMVFLVKLVHELREAQQQAIVLSRKTAVGRLAMFLDMLDRRLPRQKANMLVLPMSRTDIAEFVGLSLEAVSRAATELERRGIVAFEGRRGVRILDQARLKRLAGTA
jgi:CRP-like cAMP-binding protein